MNHALESDQVNQLTETDAVTHVYLQLPLVELLRATMRARLFRDTVLKTPPFLMLYCEAHGVPVPKGTDLANSELLLRAIKAEYFYRLSSALPKNSKNEIIRAKETEYLLKALQLGSPRLVKPDSLC